MKVYSGSNTHTAADVRQARDGSDSAKSRGPIRPAVLSYRAGYLHEDSWPSYVCIAL